MNTITLQFCQFDSLVGRIISYGTQAGKTGADHVDIVLSDGSLLGAQHEDGLGGMPSGVQIRPSQYLFTCGGYGAKRVMLKTTPETAQAAYDWALSMIGTSYDTGLIESIALGGTDYTEGKLICSGLATGMITQPSPSFIGHNLIRPWRAVTPEQLLLICNGFAEVVRV